ncbi:MAG: serine hydrolase [Pseudohongiellaceae bacterium]
MHQPTLTCIALLTISLGFSISIHAQRLPMATPESVGMSSERLERLDTALSQLVADGRMAGAVSLVARDDKVVHLSAVGERYKEANDAMEVNDIFFIQSMTKAVVSSALMMLFEEGRFQLDDPISRYLPEFADKTVVRQTVNGVAREPAARQITFRHVLSHTAGVDPDRDLLSPGEEALLARRETVGETILSRADLPLGFSPGDDWDYGSSTDYVAYLVEVISGQSLDQFLKERIFEPLGMNETWYNVPVEYNNRIAALYRPAQSGDALDLVEEPGSRGPTRYFAGVNGLFSTAGDYFKFAQMILNGGEYNGARLLSPTTVNLMASNHVGDLPVRACVSSDGYGFGLGFVMVTDVGLSRDGSLTPGSFGWCGAWNTLYWIDPTEKTVMILMMQLTGGGADIRRLFPTLVMQAITESYHSGAGAIRAYAPVPR